MAAQYVAYGFRINVYAIDAGGKVSTVALHENSILGPIIIFEFLRPDIFEFLVISAFWIQYRTIQKFSGFAERTGAQVIYLPPAHYVTVSAKHLGQTASYHISIWKHVDIQKIADRFINDDGEIVFVG